MNDEHRFAIIIKAKWMPWLIALAFVILLSVMTAGIYAGARGQFSRDVQYRTDADTKVAAAQQDLKDQQLVYEKRLGEQSARYALEAGSFVTAMQNLDRAIAAMQTQNRIYASQRKSALDAATANAKAAADEARDAKARLADIQKKQEQTQATAAVAASAAVQTKNVLENAQYPAAAVPKHEWGK